MRLGESTAEAVERALQNASPGAARVGAVVAGHGAEQAGEQAVHGLAVPAVCADVSYVDGVTGGNVFLLPVEGARRLAATMMGEDGAAEAEGAELSELELSAVGEAMNQMMSAAALATSSVLGQEVEIAPPQIRVVTTEAEAAEILRASAAPHVLTVSFTVADVSARLVQLVPNAFVVRMDRALDAQTTEYTTAPLGDGAARRAGARVGRARPRADAGRHVAGPAHRLGRRARPRGRGPRRPLRRRPALRHRPPAGGRGRQPRSSRSRQVLGLQDAAAAVAELGAASPRSRTSPHAADEPEPEARGRRRSSSPKRSHKLNPSPQQKARRCDMARVLVVDDAAFMRKMVSDVLLGGGHEVVGEAGDGVEAVERYQELRPEVTTLDITMPEKDGLSALREIIAARSRRARVVMCSALGQESKVLESIKLGAKDFVVKPFQADRVLGAVEKALS